MTPSAGTGARIGIFGGTFDPVHRGHLAVAAAVHRVLGLDRTLLMVANLPWQKAGLRSVTPAEDRYAMVAAAVEGRPGLEAGRQEIDRGGPSYTVDTADELLRLDPAAELFVVVGADVVPDLGTWHDHGRLRDRGRPAGDRPSGRPRRLAVGHRGRPPVRRVEHRPQGAPRARGAGGRGHPSGGHPLHPPTGSVRYG